MMKNKIPWAKPVFWGNEIKYVNRSLKSMWISGGSFVEKLEIKFSNLFKNKYCLSVSNGTAAINLAFLAIGIKPGDEIIVPGFGYLAAANVALQLAAKPIFCDVDSKTWCMTSKNIEKCITSKTRAIVVIHTYGNVCEMKKIMSLARKFKIKVIEDTAEAFLSKYENEMAGSFGHISTFSFHATKTVTTGEGGMVVTSSKKLFNKMKLFRSHGLKRLRHYWHELPGHNFRLTNFQAAMGVAQLESIKKIIQNKKRIFLAYKNHLKEIDAISFQSFSKNVKPVIWAVAIKLNLNQFKYRRDKILEKLNSFNIECRPGFYSAQDIKYIKCKFLETSKILSSTIISLPTYSSLSNKKIKLICNKLKSLLKK